MALTRKALKAMGLTEEQVDSIVEMHTEVKDNLKQQLKEATEKADQFEAVKKELDKLKSKAADGFEEKYNSEHAAFEDFKAKVEAEKSFEKKKELFIEVAKKAKVSDKRVNSIIRLEKDYINGLTIDDRGNLKNPAEVETFIKNNYDEYIVTTSTVGVNTENPPANNGGANMTKEQIRKISDPIKRQKAMADNPELFGLKL